VLSAAKLCKIVFKYTPQMLENWRRRSTRSWNAYTVLLDLGGSLLSTVQLLLVFGLVENSVKPWNGPTPMNA